MKPKGVNLPNAPGMQGETEVVRLFYDIQVLQITVEDEAGLLTRVEFDDVIGFRVLDERDMLDFWPTFSTHNGWVFEIFSGGWHDLESQRRGSYLVPEMFPAAREFLVTGLEDCVSVIAVNNPRFVTPDAGIKTLCSKICDSHY